MAFNVKEFLDISRFLEDSRDRILVLAVFDSSFFRPSRDLVDSFGDCDRKIGGLGTSNIVDCRALTPPEILKGWPIWQLDFSNTLEDANECFLALPI
jgi:hypothetical protein